MIFLSVFALCCVLPVEAILTRDLGESKRCEFHKQKACDIDGYVGSGVIYEDVFVRVWNFTLAPGEMTSLHRHDYDYHFVAIEPTQLEVYGENGSVLFDFRAEGTLGFRLNGEFLEPINIKLPHPVPRVHAAKNIGPNPYYEILFESKTGLDRTALVVSPVDMGTSTRQAMSFWSDAPAGVVQSIPVQELVSHAPPTVVCKPWIEQVYDATGLTSLFGGGLPADLPRCQPLATRVYDAFFGPQRPV